MFKQSISPRLPQEKASRSTVWHFLNAGKLVALLFGTFLNAGKLVALLFGTFLSAGNLPAALFGTFLNKANFQSALLQPHRNLNWTTGSFFGRHLGLSVVLRSANSLNRFLLFTFQFLLFMALYGVLLPIPGARSHQSFFFWAGVNYHINGLEILYNIGLRSRRLRRAAHTVIGLVNSD